MKILSIQIKNIGLLGDVTLELNKPLILLYGEIKQGKTTCLNAVRWVLGGPFPTDIIKHGETEASIHMTLSNGSITREFYVARDGTTKAREVVFMQDGAQIKNPVAALKQFVNPFLLNQDYLRNMTEPERKRFFVELFHIDTTELDTTAARLELEAQNLRAKLTGYGEIDLTPQPRINTIPITQEIAARNNAHGVAQGERRAKLAALRAAHSAACAAASKAMQDSTTRNQHRGHLTQSIAENSSKIFELEKQIGFLTAENAGHAAWLENNPEMAPPGNPVPSNEIGELEALLQVSRPDTGALEAELLAASAQNVRAEQAEKNQARAAEKEKDAQQLQQTVSELTECRNQKIARLAKMADECQIPGVKFDAAGNLIYEDTQAGMLSTSQIMKFSAALSALYPDGFGLDLIDRAESLGKSIFSFIEKAKAEDKTILATIVGEKPATIPADVGVFVVEQGKLI
jgi:hypothetical protein